MRGDGVPCARIGNTGGDAINIAGQGPVSVKALATAFESWFPAYMGSALPSGQV
jgi:phosphoribosylformylglycinamidine synthase